MKIMLYVVSTGIPGIVLWISTLFYCIFVWFTGISCGQQVPNVIRIHLFYVIIDAIGSFHHLLTV